MDNPLASKAGDTPKQKKHREQVIVVGTVVLVILTFMMVKNRGSSASPGEPTGNTGQDGSSGDGVGGVAGGGGGSDPYSYLPAALAALPGQVQALAFGAEMPQLKTARKRVRTQKGTIARLRKRNRKQGHEIKGLEHKLAQMQHHPRRPKHPITVHHKSAPHRAHATHYGTSSPPIRRT